MTLNAKDDGFSHYYYLGSLRKRKLHSGWPVSGRIGARFLLFLGRLHFSAAPVHVSVFCGGRKAQCGSVSPGQAGVLGTGGSLCLCLIFPACLWPLQFKQWLSLNPLLKSLKSGLCVQPTSVCRVPVGYIALCLVEGKQRWKRPDPVLQQLRLFHTCTWGTVLLGLVPHLPLPPFASLFSICFCFYTHQWYSVLCTGVPGTVLVYTCCPSMIINSSLLHSQVFRFGWHPIYWVLIVCQTLCWAPGRWRLVSHICCLPGAGLLGASILNAMTWQVKHSHAFQTPCFGSICVKCTLFPEPAARLFPRGWLSTTLICESSLLTLLSPFSTGWAVGLLVLSSLTSELSTFFPPVFVLLGYLRLSSILEHRLF